MTLVSLHIMAYGTHSSFHQQAITPTGGFRPDESLPGGKLEYVAPSGMDAFWTSFKLAFALPWRRFKNDSILVIKVIFQPALSSFKGVHT